MYKNGEFNALIDFDDANYTYLLFDLACLIEPFIPEFKWNNWHECIASDIMNLSQTKQMVFKYQRHRALSDIEKNQIIWQASKTCDLNRSKKALKPYIEELVETLFNEYPKLNY